MIKNILTSACITGSYTRPERDSNRHSGSIIRVRNWEHNFHWFKIFLLNQRAIKIFVNGDTSGFPQESAHYLCMLQAGSVVACRDTPSPHTNYKNISIRLTVATNEHLLWVIHSWKYQTLRRNLFLHVFKNPHSFSQVRLSNIVLTNQT